MGRRGPPRTPTLILAARGSWKAKERTGEPEPEPFATPCPSHLRPMAKRMWAILTRQLTALGVIGQTDANVLARYCQTYAKWREAEDYIAENGSIQHGPTGASVHPYAMLALKLGEQLRSAELALGLSPAARANLAKTPEKKTDAKDRFFKEDSA